MNQGKVSKKPEIGSFEKELVALRQRTQLLDSSVSEPPNRPSTEFNIPEQEEPGQSNSSINPDKEIRKDFLKYLQSDQAKVREEAFKLVLAIIKSEEDTQHKDALILASEQISFVINEKNLKIQMILVEIIEILVDKNLLSFSDNEKMFCFNLLDKFLSSNNRKLKAKTKAILTKIILQNQDSCFEVLKGFLMKANPKMTKALLFLLLSNEALQDVDPFTQMEMELSEFCNKNYGHRMKDIKGGVLKLIHVCLTKFGEDFLSSISKISKKDKETCLKLVKNHTPKNKNKTIIKRESIHKVKKPELEEKPKTQREIFKQYKTKKIPDIYSKAWAAKVSSKAKWKVKFKLLETFLDDVKDIKKIESSENVRHLAKLGILLSKNSVLILRIQGINILGFLFWGLRKQIKKMFKSVLKDLLVMLKDKKSLMIKALIDTICAGYFIIGPKELYEEIKVYNLQRNKDIRLNILSVVIKLISFSFEENKIKEFLMDYMGLFISYSEDKDISVKRKLMTMLKGLIVQGRKDLGGTLVGWIEGEISKQVKGSQKMINSLGEYSPEVQQPGPGPTKEGFTSLHQIEIESPQKQRPLSKKIKRKSSPKIMNRKAIVQERPSGKKQESLPEVIRNLQNSSMSVCEASLSKLVAQISSIGPENPLFRLNNECFAELLSGIKSLLKNPVNPDSLNVRIIEVCTLLFDKLNSRHNNLTLKNIKMFLSEIWLKSRSEHILTRNSAINLITRIGNNQFYFADLIKTGTSVIANQNINQFDVRWNKKIVSILSCFDWFVNSNLQEKSSLIFHLIRYQAYDLFQNCSQLPILIRVLHDSIKKMTPSFSLESVLSSLPTEVVSAARKNSMTFLPDLCKPHNERERNLKHSLKASFNPEAQGAQKSASPSAQSKPKTKYKHLECVLKMREPNSIEISHLHEFMAWIFSGFNLNDSLVRDFFGFEQKKLESGTEMIISFLDSICANPSIISMLKCKYMILGLVSCIYLRLFDTWRFGIYKNMMNLMQAVCKTISKLKIMLDTDNEGMVLVNIMAVLVQRTKNFWESIHSTSVGKDGRGSFINSLHLMADNLSKADSSPDQLSPSKLEAIFSSPLQQINGKFKLLRLHSRILQDITFEGISAEIYSKIFVYRLLIKNSAFRKEDKNEVFPRFSILNLFEMVMIEHLVGDLHSPEIFELFWADLSDKIKYFLNFYQYIKGDPDKSVQYLEQFLVAVRNLKTGEGQDSIYPRETLRLKVINGFFNSNPQLYKPVPAQMSLESKDNKMKMNLPSSRIQSALSLTSKPLYSLLCIKIVREAMEKLMGLDLPRFINEEKNSLANPMVNTQENLEKEVGNSMLSKSLLGDESILGSVFNIDFNLNSKKDLYSRQQNTPSQFLSSLWQNLMALLRISQIPEFLSHMNILEASELFFKMKFLIGKIQSLIPDYKCALSIDNLPVSFDLSPLLQKGLPVILEVLSISFQNFQDLNSPVTIIKIFSLTTVLMRFEEKTLQKFFIKQFRLKMKEQTEFRSETFLCFVHWFDTVEYIYDFLTTELDQMMTSPQAFEQFGWLRNHHETHSKIIQILTDKLGFAPTLWSLSFFINFDQQFYSEEVLKQAPRSFLWGTKAPTPSIEPDANPNSLLRSSLFCHSKQESFFCTSRLLHWARLTKSVVSSPLERKSLQDSFHQKRDKIKNVLIQILSKALFEMIQKEPVLAKELIMTRKNEFSPEMFGRLLMILDHQVGPGGPSSRPTKSKDKLSIRRDANPLKHIQLENQLNAHPAVAGNAVGFNKSGDRFSVYRNKMKFNQMRQHFKKEQEKQGNWRGQHQETFGTRSPMQRRKEWNTDKFHSQFGLKQSPKDLKHVITSEFKLEDQKK